MSFKYIQMFWVILLLRIVRELTASCSIISHVFERGEQFQENLFVENGKQLKSELNVEILKLEKNDEL